MKTIVAIEGESYLEMELLKANPMAMPSNRLCTLSPKVTMAASELRPQNMSEEFVEHWSAIEARRMISDELIVLEEVSPASSMMARTFLRINDDALLPTSNSEAQTYTGKVVAKLSTVVKVVVDTD